MSRYHKGRHKDRKDEDDEFSLQSTSSTNRICPLGKKNRTKVVPAKSISRIQERAAYVHSNRNEIPRASRHENQYHSSSRTEPRVSAKSKEDTIDKFKSISKEISAVKEGKVFSNPEFIVSEYWKSASDEIPMKLIELFKENNLEKEDSDVPLKRQKLSLEDEKEKLSYTKEFHVLTEVQKAKILVAVEDAIKKLANSDFSDCLHGTLGHHSENPSFTSANLEKYFSKNFLLPWVIMKLVEMVLCHITQLTFLSDDTYFQRKKEFLPVVVTYYFTLFIVIVSLVVHISCYSYIGVQNPCYFMGIVSSSILSLTAVLGIFILLFSMEYYKSFRAILVLIFVGTLLCMFIAELCFCYIEVKNIWHRMERSEQFYVP